MASLTWWTWVWVNSGNWWWTGMPGMLQSMGSQRVRRDWATELIEQGVLFYHEIFSSGLKKKKKFYVTKQRNVGKKFVLFSFSRDPDPFLLLESSRPLPPFLGPWTPYQPTQDLILSFPTFLSGEYGCWWKRGTSLILELLGWLNVWLLWVWTATNSVDMHTLFGKWLGKNKTWLIIAIWKGRIEYSPLKEFAFNQK